MNFANKPFLIALAAAALPILIHLLTRDRIRKVAFSSLRFFAKTSARVLRRKKFQEAMLLAMRVLIVAMLAMAFARPFFPDRASAEADAIRARTARVIVADVSGSMARPGCVEAQKQAAQKALGELSEGRDAAALITFSDKPTTECELITQFGDLRAKIKSLQAGFGSTNIAEALRQADEMLRRNQSGTKEIVLISDLQKNGWQGALAKLGQFKLAAGVKLTIRPISGGNSAGDLTITETDCPESLVLDNSPRTLAVRIRNSSGKDVADVPVTLTLGGKAVGMQKVNVRSGSTAAVRFNYTFTAAGDNPGAIEIGDGALAAAAGKADADRNFGKVFYFNARVIPRIPVLILNGAPSSSATQDGAFFLSKALAPEQDSAFAVRSIAAASATSGDIKDAMVVVVANAGRLPSGVAAAMSELLARGGGVLFLPGDRVTGDEFNAAFGAIAPCKLRRTLAGEAIAGEIGGWALGTIDYEHPIFDIFLRPHHGDFSTVRFFHRWEVSDSQLSRVVTRFDDGKPAILERQLGRGISMLMASSPDLRWSNLPLRAVFLPYLHQTVRYLAIRSEKKTAYGIGSRLAVSADCRMTDPAGKVLHEPPAPAEVPAALPGSYTQSGAETFCYAVNSDPAEADTSAVSPDEIAAAVVPTSDADSVAAAAPDEIKQDKNRWGIWWFIAAALACMIVLELFVANKTLRH